MPRIYKPVIGPSDNKAEVPKLETKAPPKQPKESEKKESGDR